MERGEALGFTCLAMADPAEPVANQVHEDYRNGPRRFIKKWAAEEATIHHAHLPAQCGTPATVARDLRNMTEIGAMLLFLS